MEFMMGGVILFGGNFAPKDWAFCQGQLQSISGNQALFAILGTTWGGDGRTTYALPDLRGRVPIGAGRGIGLTEVYQGHMNGFETSSLQLSQLPSHSHLATFTPTGGSPGGINVQVEINATTTEGDSATPSTGAYLAQTKPPSSTGPDKAEWIYSSSPGTTVPLGGVSAVATGGGGIDGGTVSVGHTGASAPFSLMQPTLGSQYIIALNGIFPSRN